MVPVPHAYSLESGGFSDGRLVWHCPAFPANSREFGHQQAPSARGAPVRGGPALSVRPRIVRGTAPAPDFWLSSSYTKTLTALAMTRPRASSTKTARNALPCDDRV
jgi:hypothetical protein